MAIYGKYIKFPNLCPKKQVHQIITFKIFSFAILYENCFQKFHILFWHVSPITIRILNYWIYRPHLLIILLSKFRLSLNFCLTSCKVVPDLEQFVFSSGMELILCDSVKFTKTNSSKLLCQYCTEIEKFEHSFSKTKT